MDGEGQPLVFVRVERAAWPVIENSRGLRSTDQAPRVLLKPSMLAKRVIPCLDVDRGRVVKGTNFLNLRDAGDPVEVAARYEAEGADELVFLDITASHEGRDIMLDVVRRTAEVVFMPLTVGGGIRTIEDIRGSAERRVRQGVDQFGRLQRSRVRARRPPGSSAASASW